MHQLHRYDEGLRHSLKTVLGCSVFDLSWKQATLPIRLGYLISVCLWKFNACLVLGRVFLDCDDLTSLSYISGLDIYV